MICRLATTLSITIWRSLGNGMIPARPALSTALPGWCSRLSSLEMIGFGPLGLAPAPKPLAAIHSSWCLVACTSAGYSAVGMRPIR